MSLPGTPNPEDIISAGQVSPIQEGEPKVPSQGTPPFSSYMQGQGSNPLMNAGKSPQISPFDLAHGQVPAAGPTFASIQDQAKMAQTTLGDVSNQLQTPNLKLKQSTKYLLKNKLNSANGYIKSASEKMGANIVDQEEVPSGASPLDKFLGLVTSGQNQLQAVQDQMKQVAAKGESMSPGDMLLIQVKLSKAQQQITFTSMLLGKAMDNLKTFMNIQL